MSAAITDQTAAASADLQPLWHHKAARELVEAGPAEDLVRSWKVWQKHLRKRKKPVDPNFLRKKKAPLIWGWPNDWELAVIKENIQSPTSLAGV